MKKTKILFILLLSLSSLFIACDKGEDSVDFTYSQDSKDPRIFYFQASGSSDYGDFDYRWDFGKGNTSSGSNASHQFDDYGNHVVTLYADIDKSGIHSTVSKKIEIDIPKITNVDFSYTTSSTNPKEYYFIATGKSNYGTVDFEWDFGQNNIETGERATAAFGEYGFNDVTLTASIKNLGNDIEAVSTSKTIEVLAPEFRDLDFTYTTNSEDGRVLYLKANSKVTYGTVNYRWNFGNGQGQSGEETSFTFDSYGKKTIQLTGTIKETGISTTRTMTVDVQPPVFKNFNINYEVSNSNPLTVFLTASAKSEQGGKLSYQWNLGQGVIYTGQNITHTFDSYGEKTITITVKNTDADIEDTKTEIITLDTPVIKDLAYIYKRDQNNPLKAYFTASSNSDYDITYEWDFGDPNSGVIENSSSDERAVHKFTKSDLYQIKLCVNANELITPLCVTKKIGILEEPVTGISYNGNTGYSLKDGKNTWGRRLTLSNVWKELVKDDRIKVTSYVFNSHIGCYGKSDKSIDGTRTITSISSDILAQEGCDAENGESWKGNENVTYTLKNGFSITKENM